MGCCSSKKIDATDPVKSSRLKEEENILDSPFTKEVKRERDGTLVPGQIPRKVTKVYDALEHADHEDIEANFIENPIGVVLKPWLPVPDSKYLQYDPIYKKPPVKDPQPELLIDILQGSLNIYDPKTGETIQYQNKIFNDASRSISLPDKTIFICGGKKPRSCYSINTSTGKIKELDSLFEGREYHSVAYLNEMVLASGGMGYEELSSCEIYFKEKWSVTGNMNYKRSLHSSIGLEKAFYVCGGMKQRTIEKWENGKWTVINVQLPFNISRIGMVAATAYSFFVVGGEKAGVDYSYKAWEIDFNRLKVSNISDINRIGVFSTSGTTDNKSCTFFMNSWKFIYNIEDNSWNYTM
jgi:hypothetical protein